ncbi:hypothetical protein ABID22_002511 [Pontibacter aydingkolensis]|uniref:DUF4129 domain-containing protein n=1 Tax=Pontibacter aydingkolensis TaxID=1911536 RepID=A0ABS7CWI3_9BACT|nr:DUF4129 domain-containing protein [Pontibacter aydingkolensis]MBW7468157.1 DUF4129 domain-containing protein [Pontibacter aydingkolensis]
MKETFKQPYTFILILCLLLGFGPATYAQSKDSIPASQVPVTVRQFDPEQVEELRSDKDFQYFEEVKPDKTFLEKVWNKFTRWLSKVFYSTKSGPVWEYLIYAFIVAGIIFIIVKLLRMDMTNLFSRKSIESEMAYEVYEENIHEMDIRSLIEEAIGQRDFRKAIRLHYLQSLKNLTDHGFILWKPGKTNRSYINEIKAPELRREFEQLTSMFEYVWYGGAALGDELFTSARAEFILFDKQIKQYA